MDHAGMQEPLESPDPGDAKDMDKNNGGVAGFSMGSVGFLDFLWDYGLCVR